MKLRKNIAGNGFLGNYTMSIGVTEAKALNFIDTDGNGLELEKIIDMENNQLIIRLKKI